MYGSLFKDTSKVNIEGQMSVQTPLVSIITPVYNGEEHLSECIESVLAQTYQNWEYIIVNNCSTDGTLEIVQQYANNDERITIHNNDEFVDVIRNHNIAFQQISTESIYCKLIQADDLLFPECISSMIDVFESNPGVGVVGAYSSIGRKVKCEGMLYPNQLIDGREISRKTLLGEMYLFFSPSSILIRSALIRSNSPYYPGSNLDADIDALYRDFISCDFGFVYQVLTFIRLNLKSVTVIDRQKSNTQLLSRIRLLIKYGPTYLSEAEFQSRLSDLWDKYYQSLAHAVCKLQNLSFWSRQSSELNQLGYPLQRIRLMKAVVYQLIFRPRQSALLMKHALFSKQN